MFFHSLFALTKYSVVGDLKYVETLCALGEFDSAIKFIEACSDLFADLARRTIAIALCRVEKWDKALETASSINNKDEMLHVLIEFFSSGRLAGGTMLVSKLADKKDILKIWPALELLAKGQLDEAIKLRKGHALLSAILDKAQARYCYQAFEKGNLKGIKQRILTIEDYQVYQDVVKAHCMQMIKRGKFTAVIEAKNKLLISDFDISMGILDLCLKGCFKKAKELTKYCQPFKVKALRYIVSMCKYSSEEKFDLIKRASKAQLKYIPEEFFQHISKAMVKAREFDKAIDFIGQIRNLVIKCNAIRLINEFFVETEEEVDFSQVFTRRMSSGLRD